MKLEDFEIGKTFYWSAGFKYLCTDKGSRTISAIFLDHNKKDPSWFQGPPYNVSEIVLDEIDIKSCYTNDNDMISDRVEELEHSYHPLFLSDNVFKMIKLKDVESINRYPRKRILDRDRVDNDGKIWHPYSVSKNEKNEWIIKIFELFECVYSEIHEDEFVKFKRSTEEDLKNRSINFNKKDKN